jgi:selenocysteine lyase/cysteine desulfurase
MDETRSALRPLAAELLHADEDEIAIVESTTHGLSLAAQVLPLKRGDRVVLSDLEFLQVAVPWCQKRDEVGIELDVVPNRNGRFRIEDWPAFGQDPGLAVSSVQWSNGFRCDLQALSDLCARGTFGWSWMHSATGAIHRRETPMDV